MNILPPTLITVATGPNTTPAVLLTQIVGLFKPTPQNLVAIGKLGNASGGTLVTMYLQTLLTDWFDICSFSFSAPDKISIFNMSAETPSASPIVPTQAALPVNTSVNGLIGTQLRVVWQSTGTFGLGTFVQLDVFGGS